MRHDAPRLFGGRERRQLILVRCRRDADFGVSFGIARIFGDADGLADAGGFASRQRVRPRVLDGGVFLRSLAALDVAATLVLIPRPAAGEAILAAEIIARQLGRAI